MCLYAVSLCGCVAVGVGTGGTQKTTDSLELGFQSVVSCLM